MSTPTPIAFAYLRISTEEQLKGHGIERQTKGAFDYATKNELSLTEERIIKDEGVSAYTGKNIIKGNLGTLLNDVRTGKIPKGSHLIVESLDRLSRQGGHKSNVILDVFLSAGILVHTYADNHIYGKNEFLDYFKSGIEGFRAKSESEIKIKRQKETWEGKRAKGNTKPLTARCPAWLVLPRLSYRGDTNDRKFTVNKERAEVVKKIFELSAGGLGNYSIVKELNKEGIPPFSNARGWAVSSVADILLNRSVLGEFQPCKLETTGSKNRVPIGEPIVDYYPQIIKPELFERAFHARQQRKGQSGLPHGGRKGANISNLFSGLAKCAYCQAPMHYITSGRGDNYLLCSNVRTGLNCEHGKGWKYPDFEASFLMFVEELDLASITSKQQEAVKRNDLDKAVTALEGKLAINEQQQDNIIALQATKGGNTERVAKKLNELTQAAIALQTDIEAKRKTRTELDVEAKVFYQAHSEIKDLIARLQDGDYRLRAEVAAKLKHLISSLTIATVGSAPLLFGSVIPVTRQAMDIVKKHKGVPLARRVLGVFNSENSHRRYFSVGFKTGNTRIVFPDDKNPLALEQMVLSTEQDGLQITPR
jgi:DNA invertase Pin-like site-specific DNA recombinase